MIVKDKLHASRLTKSSALTINQGILKDKSIIRQSLGAAFRALKPPD
jgi:hypothetical protein